jgi:hypothetical protein
LDATLPVYGAYVFEESKAYDPASEKGEVENETVKRICNRGNQNDGSRGTDGGNRYGVGKTRIYGTVNPVDEVKEFRKNPEDNNTTSKFNDTETRRNNLVSDNHGDDRASMSGYFISRGDWDQASAAG